VRVGAGDAAMQRAVTAAVEQSLSTDRPVALVFAPAATR
jgi:hypothetical protein